MKRIAIKTLPSLLVLFLWAGSSGAQDYSFSYTCDNQGCVVHPDSVALFITVLTNTGAQADTYRVVLDKDLPVPWFSLACNSMGCFPDSVRITLASAEAETITVYIWPFSFTGAGTVTMRVSSLGDPGQTTAMPLTAITNTGVDVLVVDDDGTQGYETYYQAALDSAGKSHGTLDNTTTVIDADMMASFPAVVWLNGEATPVLTEEDRQAISAYLEGGGRLFISGQNIAYALCDPASGESDTGAVAWFQGTFYVEYSGNDSDTLILDGIDGNVISDGLTINIFGGDGANNQTSADIISPLPGSIPQAYPFFGYRGWRTYGAVTVSTGIYRIAYLAFGFEAIDSTADRALLMDRIMDYFSGPTSVESQGEIASHPQNFFLSPNYPNPFNAFTVLSLTIPGDEPLPASLKIYN
ncbi:hypothetical protein KAU04_07030, partial [bacterium]|nr:hypothetical protein [bacterium]